MGINTGNGGKGGNGSNGNGGEKSHTAEGSLLDSFIEPLAPNIDVQVIEDPQALLAAGAAISPPVDRKAPVVQLFPNGAPGSAPSELKPYALEVADGEGTLTATFATFDEAAEAFVYRAKASATLKYLRDGESSRLAWIEGAEEKFANEQVRQSILKLQRRKAAYAPPGQPPVAAGEPAPAPLPIASATTAVIEQYQRILGAYNHKNGVYRGMFNIKVLEDMGSEIMFHRTSEEATQACVALALKKDWAAVEIGGTPERKERAWLAYTMAGIKVTNYSPPLHILERYQAITGGQTASANVDRPAIESAAPEPEVAPAPVRMRARSG